MPSEPAELVRLGVAGLCGVANRHFNDKHWGAAAVAAGLFARQRAMSTGARSAMIAQADRLVKSKAEWFPASVDSGPGEVADVVEALNESASSLNLLGHDTIFAALAMRAMREQPELATSANVDALVGMVNFAATRGPGGPFGGWEDPAAVRVGDGDDVPLIETMDELAASAVTVFASVGTVYDGFDRGVVHHVLTHAHAVIELDRLGHTRAARAGVGAHRIYRKLMSRRPSDGAEPLPRGAAQPDFGSDSYWQQDLRGRDDWLYGHVFKVAFAWTGLNPVLTTALRQQAKPILATSMIVT